MLEAEGVKKVERCLFGSVPQESGTASILKGSWKRRKNRSLYEIWEGRILVAGRGLSRRGALNHIFANIMEVKLRKRSRVNA